MPTICSFYGITIRMYFNDHAPPHFHARYGEFEATIDIETLEVVEGELPARALTLAREWGIMNKEHNGVFVYWDVVEVRPESNYRLFVCFKDGLSGHIQLREPELTGVLTPLGDPAFFAQAFIDQGAVAWPGEIDLAPDAMHAEIASRKAA